LAEAFITLTGWFVLFFKPEVKMFEQISNAIPFLKNGVNQIDMVV